MKPSLPLLLLAALGACATDSRPYNPVHEVRYSALGADPYWQLTIGDDRIVLRTAPDPGAAPRPHEQVWPRTLPRTVDGVTTWRSGAGETAITVAARPGPCGAEGGATWRDAVTVTVAGRELDGCGGPLIDGASE